MQKIYRKGAKGKGVLAQIILCDLCVSAVKIGLLQILLCSAQIIPSGLTEWVFDDRTSAMSSFFKGDRERKRASGFTRVIRFSNEPSAIFFVVLGKACSGQHSRGSSLAGTGPLGMH